MRSRGIVVLMVAACLLAGRAASAQYVTPAGLQPSAARNGQPDSRGASAVLLEGSRVNGAAHGALVGAGVGAVAGIVVMALTPHSDHSEDAIAYVVGAAGGAFVGLLVGALIGSSRPR